MFILYIFALISVSIVGVQTTLNTTYKNDAAVYRARAEVGSLSDFHTALTQYSMDNPGYTGSASASLIAAYLPTWFRDAMAINGRIDTVATGRMITTWGLSAAGGSAADALRESSQNSVLVGVAQGGVLVSPVQGVMTSIVLPTGVPDGAIVCVRFLS